MNTLNKKARTIFTLFLVFTFAVTLAALPFAITVKAELTWYPYLTAAPNPVGIGQRVLLVFGFTMPTSPGSAYRDWTLYITDPDGNVRTVQGLDTETTGSTFYVFTPDKVGTWKLKAHFPGGDVLLGAYVPESVFVPSADTNEFSLTVQADPIPEYPAAPLPTEYWQFPIYGENRAWNKIAGNWLMSGYDRTRDFDAGAGAFNPYTTVPKTGHILWTKPQLLGGIVGGATEMTYYTGSSYRRELMPPVIISGRLYYNVQEPPGIGTYCVDLATGETIWCKNLSFPDGSGGVIEGFKAGIELGQVLTLDTMNWHGGIPLLWSVGKLPWSATIPTWAVWNAWDGNLLYTIVNTQTPFYQFGDFYIDEATGTLMACIVDAQNDRLIIWNSTLMFDQLGLLYMGIVGLFGSADPVYNLDWNAGVQLNVTIPHFDIPAGAQYPVIFDPKDPSVVIVSTQSSGDTLSGAPFAEAAFSMTDGHMLWNKTRNEGTWEAVVGGKAISIADDCYVVFRKETRQLYAYSVSTGEKKWVSDPRRSQWGMFVQGINFAYGKCYAIGYDGMIYAYDAKTGKELWTWGPVNAGLETPYGVYPLYGGTVAADHKLIVCNGEHSANSPLYRGERMYVVDTDTGETLWSISGWYQQPSAANGVIVVPNGYDGKIYCFGKGPSATTVTALPKVTMHGSKVLVEGTVIDISPGTQQNEEAKRFPNGVPVVSDECMSAWMEYVYMQKPRPNNVTGVEVVIEVLDPNGNYYEVARTRS
ncbi:MAG: PQQ-binding-like beta-propeller repeat protein, partial [Candidatus Bathyarchaeia archaeon]